MVSGSSASDLDERARHARAGGPALLVIAGPTATGKTGLSLAVASRLRAEGTTVEIISADSRQVYRGLDIGTAKVSRVDRAGIPHHGLDLVDPDGAFSVADFVNHTRSALQAIGERRGLAILVGGTGLYLRAVARGLDTDALAHDPGIRAGIEEQLEREGLEVVADRLVATAPASAARIDLRNPRRVARAMEIAAIVGDRPRPAPTGYPGPVAWLGLDVERDTHREWIARRARAQFGAGLVEEARVLRERYDPALPAFSAIGYREAWAVLDGRMTHEAAIDEDARRNVAFAKRQRTWFRRERDIDWLDARADPLSRALDRARSILRPCHADH